VYKERSRIYTFFENVMGNVAASVAIAVVPAVALALIAIYSSNPMVTLQWAMLVLITVNLAGIAWIVLSQRRRAKWTSTGTIIRSSQDGKPYLMDRNGRPREIPDDLTLSYLSTVIGLIEDIPLRPSQEIAKICGEKLPSIERWKYERPIPPDERAKKDLHSLVLRTFEVTKKDFSESANPQRIIVEFTNRGKKPLFIRQIKFQHHELPEVALLASYAKDGSYILIPFDQQAANISPRSTVRVELHLSQKWQRADIERTKGNWGFIILDVTCDGNPVDSLLYML
jgi:hypothetical protein